MMGWLLASWLSGVGMLSGRTVSLVAGVENLLLAMLSSQ